MAANGVARLHQVVLVGPVGRALVVGVVLVEVDRRVDAGHGRDAAGRLSHDQFTRFVPPDDIERLVTSGRRVLRVRVVDIEPGAVGQDHVGHAGVFLGFDELLRDAAAPPRSKPRASRSGDSSSKSQAARRARPAGSRLRTR